MSIDGEHYIELPLVALPDRYVSAVGVFHDLDTVKEYVDDISKTGKIKAYRILTLVVEQVQQST